jgi:hypothetical protein
MRKYGTSALMALCVFFLNFSTLVAQESATPIPTATAATAVKTPIFGTYIPVKDTSARKFGPAFVRFGITSAGFAAADTSNQGGGAAGVRMEIGFSNKLSLVGNVEMGSINQSTLALHLHPFNSTSSRWQPYFGAGWSATAKGTNGIFSGRGGHGGFGKRGGWDGFGDFENSTITISHSLALQTGFNYLLRRRWIAHIDATYQVPLNTTVSKIATAGVRIGISRQF